MAVLGCFLLVALALSSSGPVASAASLAAPRHRLYGGPPKLGRTGNRQTSTTPASGARLKVPPPPGPKGCRSEIRKEPRKLLFVSDTSRFIVLTPNKFHKRKYDCTTRSHAPSGKTCLASCPSSCPNKCLISCRSCMTFCSKLQSQPIQI